MPSYPQLELTPQEYELEVKNILDGMSVGLVEYQSGHREKISGLDGEYEIDISARFSALGVNFLTLVECKRFMRPVGREKVQALLSKVQSIGAQKGMMFSTSGFQSGAIEFAEVHGLALIGFADGRSTYFTKSFGSDSPKTWSQIPQGVPKIAGWLFKGNRRMLVEANRPNYLLAFLKDEEDWTEFKKKE